MSAPLEKLLRDARIDLILSRIEKDETVINELIGHIDSNSRSVKFNAILVLGLIGQKSVNGIQKVINCLEDEDWSICREAARSLGNIGEFSKQAVPKLSLLLEDKEPTIRKEAAIALGKIKNPTSESISSLINALNDKNEDVRTEVANALGAIGPDAFEAIPSLMKTLKDVNWAVRTASAHSISQIGKGSIKAIPSLLHALNDDDWRVRFRVINTLVEIGEPAIPNLIEKLDSGNVTFKGEAVEALGEMKISDPNLLDHISELLFDRNESVRGKTANALRSIGKSAVPALLQAYEKAKTKMKIIILSALGGMGIEAKEALPLVINALKTSQQDEEIVPSFSSKIKRAILTFLKDPFKKRASIRVEAARALGSIGKDTEDALHALENALNDPKSIVRREAVLSIGKLGSLAKEALPTLIKALKDENRDVRWRASEALGIIGVNTEEVISNLKNLVHDKCDYVCESAILALDNLEE